jgi:hypothetical protein
MAWHGMDCSRVGDTRASAPSSPRPCPGAVAHAAASHLAARRGAARRAGVWEFGFISAHTILAHGERKSSGVYVLGYTCQLAIPGRVTLTRPRVSSIACLNPIHSPESRLQQTVNQEEVVGGKRQRNSSCKYTPPRSSRRRTGHKDLHLPRSGTRNQQEIVWPRRRDLARTGGGPLELTAEPEEYHVAGPERW